VATPPTFTPDVALLLTDGTVMVHDYQEASKFWRLTPDIHGSYVSGTWSEMAQLPAGYEPTFFSSAVLADGRVVADAAPAELLSGGWYFATETARILGGHLGILTPAQALAALRAQAPVPR